jgi:hypothetical protein
VEEAVLEMVGAKMPHQRRRDGKVSQLATQAATRTGTRLQMWNNPERKTLVGRLTWKEGSSMISNSLLLTFR